MINAETIDKLANICNDGMELEIIQDSIKSFYEYHKIIFEMETFMKFRDKDMDREEYQDTVMNYDKRRTSCHNIVIQNVRILNRMSDRYGLDPVYTGEVSEQRPYRRILANEVLEYVEQIVKDRK